MVFGKEVFTGEDALKLDIENRLKKSPRFKNKKEAEKYFLDYKSTYLEYLRTISKNSEMFEMDFTPDSLKRLELWYFYLKENGKFSEENIDESKLLISISIYYGEILRRNTKKWKWVIDEYPFVKNTYDLFVGRLPHMGIMIQLNRKWAFYKIDNKRKQSLWREYKRYAEYW